MIQETPTELPDVPCFAWAAMQFEHRPILRRSFDTTVLVRNCVQPTGMATEVHCGRVC